MTLYQIVKKLEDIALTQPSINSAGEGNVYERMNATPSVKYGAFIVTQGTHSQDDRSDYYNLTLFFIDRLRSDMDSNRLAIQSHGKEVLTNILKVFEASEDVELNNIRFTTFTQKFADECAGCYVDVEIESIIDINCAENYFEEEVDEYYKMMGQPKAGFITTLFKCEEDGKLLLCTDYTAQHPMVTGAPYDENGDEITSRGQEGTCLYLYDDKYRKGGYYKVYWETINSYALYYYNHFTLYGVDFGLEQVTHMAGFEDCPNLQTIIYRGDSSYTNRGTTKKVLGSERGFLNVHGSGNLYVGINKEGFDEWIERLGNNWVLKRL